MNYREEMCVYSRVTRHCACTVHYNGEVYITVKYREVVYVYCTG